MIALEPNEKIIVSARRHWFVLFLRLLPLIPFIFVPLLLFTVLMVIPIAPDALIEIGGNGVAFAVFLLFSWFLFVWIGAFVVWTDYYLDVLIVTDKRIINTEQKALFSREIASLRLDKIQDITIDISGILATFMSFGNIRIQTAGEQEEFAIHFVKNPEALKQAILKEHNRVVEQLREVRIAKD
ncbi:MAG: PH domain-containing protein [Parcubacteria group bacterium]|nr:PH domain-containing protein [Parcubacteria group bacterium]